MPNTISDCIYVNNKGVEFRYKMNSEILAQGDGEDPENPKVGGAGVGPASGLVRLPSSVKPRRVLMKSTTTNKQRTITVLDPAAALWSATPPTLSIEDSDGAAQTYEVHKKHEEDFGRG